MSRTPPRWKQVGAGVAVTWEQNDGWEFAPSLLVPRYETPFLLDLCASFIRTKTPRRTEREVKMEDIKKYLEVVRRIHTDIILDHGVRVEAAVERGPEAVAEELIRFREELDDLIVIALGAVYRDPECPVHGTPVQCADLN